MKCEKELALLREAIRNERKDKRITQEELAEMLEVSPTHVKHIETAIVSHRLKYCSRLPKS